MDRRTKTYLLAGALTVVALAISLALVMRVMPAPTTEAAAAAQVGMKPGERYHEVHVDGLKLQCATCHAKGNEDYNDPLAQVFNAVDKKACLSCHSSGSQPFYGDDWQKAKVSR